jgi:hypothetical protein
MHSYYMPYPAHPQLDHSDYTRQIVQIMIPHYAAFSSYLSLHPSLVQIFSLVPISQTSSDFGSPLMLETKFCTHKEPQAKLYSRIFYFF